MPVWVLILLGIAWLTVGGGGGAHGVYFTEFRVANVAVLGLALAGWMIVAIRRPLWRPRSVLGPAFAASLVALTVSDAGSSVPRLGWDYLGYAVLGVSAYLLLQRMFDHPFLGPRLGTLAVLLAALVNVVYVLVVLIRWLAYWRELGHFAPPPLRPGYESLGLGDPSGLATVSLLLLLASVAQIGIAGERRRAAVAVLTLTTLATIFLSGSRSAWVGLAATAGVGGFLWLTSSVRRAELLSLGRSRAIQTAGAVALGCGLVGLLVLLPALRSRLGEEAVDTRSAFTHASIAMFADHPLTGVGTGMWTVERIRFTDPPDVDYYIPHAHNLPLQILAELGIVGAVAAAIAVTLVARLAIRGIKAPDPLARRLGWAVLLGGAYLCIHQLFVVYANMPAVWFAYALSVARLDTLLTHDEAPPVGSRFRVVAAALVVGLVGATAWLGYSEAASASGDRAAAAANRGDWAAALVAARDAVQRDPLMPPYLYTLGLAEAQAGNGAAAITDLRASADIDDYPIAWLNIARLELDRGTPAEAREALGQAMRLGDQQPQIAFGAALMYVELGDRAAATTALSEAFLVAPTLASDPYWADSSRQSLFTDGVDAALSRASSAIAYKLALESGRVALASDLVAAMPPDQRVVPTLVVRAWSGDHAAFHELNALARSNPLDTATVVSCRRVALMAREPNPPSSWSCEGAGSPDNALVIRVEGSDSVSTVAPVPGMPGPDASIHFLYSYRRQAPLDKLVTGIPVLEPIFE